MHPSSPPPPLSPFALVILHDFHVDFLLLDVAPHPSFYTPPLPLALVALVGEALVMCKAEWVGGFGGEEKGEWVGG